jgi:hypothetical protein
VPRHPASGAPSKRSPRCPPGTSGGPRGADDCRASRPDTGELIPYDPTGTAGFGWHSFRGYRTSVLTEAHPGERPLGCAVFGNVPGRLS